MRDLRIMDIAMNLARIGNWAADDYDRKEKRIRTFLHQTMGYIDALNLDEYPMNLRKPLIKLRTEYPKLLEEAQRKPQDTSRWAEAMMTWGNILTHRAQLVHRQ